MCEKCPIDQRYPYYGFPVTPDSHKLRDEAERYREIAIRCFVAESDCADVKRAAVAVAPAVFLPQSCGCDTPTNASVSNGLRGVRVVLTCYLTG